MALLFVYGTLMSGFPNNRLIASGNLFDPEYTLEDYALIDLGPFPGMVPRIGDSVKGEVWEVARSAIQDCDYLEGHPHFYTRVPFDYKEMMGWTYVYNLSHDCANLNYVPDGDWRKYNGQ